MGSTRWALAVGLALGLGAAAQAGGGLGLAEAVTTAWTHFPGVEAARQAAVQAQAEVGVAGVNLWPVTGVSGQWNRATDNATLGLSFPSPLPSISGTVPITDYSPSSTWTSATGLYFSWEVADFGRRQANIRYYRDLAAEAANQSELVRLQVGAHAADAYLNVIAAQEQERVARADLDRWQQIATIIHALVDQQLRAGADASRADAERAGASIRLSGAARNLATAQASLAEALGVAQGSAGAVPRASTREWLTTLPAPAAAPAPVLPAAHPEARAAQAVVAAVGARQDELARSALPRWYALAAAYGRGTGVEAPGRFAGHADGLWPATAGNWAVGLGLDFSLTRWRATDAEKVAAKAQMGQAQARQRQVLQALAADQQRAAADLNAARTIAQESPVELQAAQLGEAQARVRYQTGLAGVVDLANAEQLLAQAESDAALSQLQVWRALLESAFAAGDLAPFLATVGGH